MRRYELDSIAGLTYQSWLNRNEQKRFADLVRQWKKTNKQASIIEQMLIESLIRLHVFEQRLIDRRVFFDASPTDYKQVGCHVIDVTDEDLKRKQSEWDKYFPQVMKMKTDLLKLAMANSISLNITEETGISDLFNAIDRRKVFAHNGAEETIQA